MKLSSLALLIVGAFAVSPAVAVPVTFDFVVGSGPTGGGTFTASTIVDNTLGVHSSNPIDFTASLVGNATSANNRTWSLSEITFSTYVIGTGGSLVFSGLFVDDIPGGVGARLTGGSTGFSSPVTIGGAWRQRSVTNTPGVPDSGPGMAMLILMGFAGILAHRARRSVR